MIAMTGCSQKMAYNSLQASGKNMAKCDLIADEMEQQKCKAKFDKSYDEYQAEREAVLNP